MHAEVAMTFKGSDQYGKYLARLPFGSFPGLLRHRTSSAVHVAQDHRPRTRRSPLLPDQLPRECGSSERSDELDLVPSAPFRVIRRSWPFPQSASRRPLEPQPRCSSRCSRTTVLTSACALRPARQDADGTVPVHLQALSEARGVQTTRTLVITSLWSRVSGWRSPIEVSARCRASVAPVAQTSSAYH